jgi:hypothetical protein
MSQDEGAAGRSSNGGPTGLQNRVDELEDRLDRLGIICEAMWQLLSGEVGLSLDQLAAKVDEQRVGDTFLEEEPEPSEPESLCPDCGSAMPVGARTCLFCSARPSGSALG